MKNFFHSSMPGTFPAPFNIHFQVECLALGFDIYRTIVLIPYKAGKVVHLSRSPGCIAETHTLNMSEDFNIVVFPQNGLTFYR